MSDNEQFAVELINDLLAGNAGTGNLRLMPPELNASGWEAWRRDVLRIETATEFGLGVWSRLLGVPLRIGTTGVVKPFGFGPNKRNFRGNFYTQPVIVATIAEARIILRLKFLSLASRCDIASSNRITNTVFGGTGIRVQDGLNMTMTYFFPTQPASSIVLAIARHDILPRPSAVRALVVYGSQPAFGFGEFNLGFDQAGFGE